MKRVYRNSDGSQVWKDMEKFRALTRDETRVDSHEAFMMDLKVEAFMAGL